MDIGQLFCEIDDFFLDFEKQQVSEPLPDTETSNKRNRPSKLHTSEVRTILVVFHPIFSNNNPQKRLSYVQD